MNAFRACSAQKVIRRTMKRHRSLFALMFCVEQLIFCKAASRCGTNGRKPDMPSQNVFFAPWRLRSIALGAVLCSVPNRSRGLRRQKQKKNRNNIDNVR